LFDAESDNQNVLQMLMSFLKSKDDNMILLTSNLLIEVVPFIEFKKEFNDELLD